MIAVLGQVQNLTGPEAAFVRLVDRALADPRLVIVAVAVAFGVGAVHALAPGHGKAIAAAYLVGGRGRTRDAFLLGGVVALMHSASVIVLAVALQVALRRTGTTAASVAAVTPALRVISGMMVVGLGIALLVSQWRRARGSDHSHGHRGHDHTAPEVPPFSRRGLAVLGMSGGLLPSPSAFLVLVTTAFTGRLWLGLVLVLVFSLGLAATLTAIGLAVVRGRQALVDRMNTAAQRRLFHAAAIAGAIVVLAGGVVMTAAGIAALPG